MNTEEKRPIYGKTKGVSVSFSTSFFLCFGLGKVETNEFKSKSLIKDGFLNKFSSDFKLEAID